MSDVKVWRVFHAARYDEREEGGFIKGKCVEEYDGSFMSWGHPHMVAVEDYDALCAKVERLTSVADAEMKLREGNFAEIERLRAKVEALQAAIKRHNDGCQARCGYGDQEAVRCGWRPYFEGSGRRCPTCPTYNVIEIDGAAGQPPEGQKP